MKLKKSGKKQSLFKKENKSFSTLEEVMDYNKEFSIFYSGVENDTYFQGCYDMGVRNFLMSYHYLQKSRVSLESKYKDLGVKFFIDSGAHTYMNDDKYLDVDIDYWEKHIQKYLAWAEKNRDYIFTIVNCDFENLVGGERVIEWNEKYFEPFMLRTGIPVCFVWHQNSAKDWEYYCKRYPYVGFTSVNTSGEDISFSEYISKLKIAEKYNTLVHGFGLTRTSILPKLPLYSVDSTSWKSGFRYGQLAFWNGKKVQMLKKSDFERAFKFIDRYDLEPPIDKKLIYDYYEPEVLRANVYAYMRAEEYIRNAIKSLSYWKKAKVKNRKESDLDSIKYPSLSWINNEESNEDWEKYAEEFNISKEDKDTAINLIIDMTIFMNWDNSEYREFRDKVYNDELLKELHDGFVNRIVETNEERIEDLIKFYKDNLLGENTTLLYLGTNFDRTVKEREEYLDDREYDYEDIDEVSLFNRLSKYLPPSKEDDEESAPEVDELDDEIFEQEGIIPVRDEHGKFLKGQKKVLKPKKVFSKKFPKLACDTCYAAQKCPEYKAGYACAYNKIFDKFETRNMEDIIQAMQGIADFSLSRLQKVMMFEILDGGLPSADTTQLINQTMGILNNMKNIYDHANTEVIRQTNILRSDGTRESTTQVHNPSSGGILEKIFGDLKPEKEEENLDIDKDKIVEAEVVEEKE